MGRFNNGVNQPDVEQVEQWVDEFYGGLMGVFNVFFTHIDLDEIVERIEDIPFESLVLEQLTGESEEVKTIALQRISALVAAEISHLEAYAKQK